MTLNSLPDVLERAQARSGDDRPARIDRPGVQAKLEGRTTRMKDPVPQLIGRTAARWWECYLPKEGLVEGTEWPGR